ncbi:MAG: aspartate aminotransferase family protein [Bacteroidetes bacterium HGW-Bacteroidetes-1]|jgi:acetylornithine/succinyldiaminopimelate/putrescine aminotransferase|nr:MAG: aspartate aminotransferase family protein [Bacteroidetes bacterium HGW-Bacteroidetes-1]
MLTNRQLFQLHLGLPSVVGNPVEIVRAEGIYLFDDENHKYLDLVSGVSVSNVGHRHPKVIEAIHKQLESYMHVMVYGKFVHSPQVKLAAKLAENLPGSLDTVFFVNSGSEAIEGALKLAKRITNRAELVHFRNAYHGGTAGALSMLGDENMKNAFRPLVPGTRLLDFNNFSQIDEITHKTAAVLIEPIQAEAGIILPKKGYLEAIRDRCNKTGSLLIFDEIQMGFGRTGKLFAFEHFNAIPDIICLAKAMGGGMPIGAFISSKEKMLAFTHHPELGHITTFGGHPVSCAASLASLSIILEEDLHTKANQKGKLFEDALKKYSLVKDIRRAGLMLGVEIVPEIEIGQLMKNFKKNYLVVDQFLFHSKAFRIAPPLTITEEEINESILLIKKSLNQSIPL